LGASLVSILSEPRSSEMSSCVGVLKQLPMSLSVTFSTRCQQISEDEIDCYGNSEQI